MLCTIITALLGWLEGVGCCRLTELRLHKASWRHVEKIELPGTDSDLFFFFFFFSPFVSCCENDTDLD